MAQHTSDRTSLVLILLGIVLLLALAVGLFAILTRDLPACAGPEAIQKRFSSQLDFLENLALQYSSEGGMAGWPGTEEGKEKLLSRIERDAEWWDQVESRADLFSDP